MSTKGIETCRWERKYVRFKPTTIRDFKRIANRSQRRKAKAELRREDGKA